MPSKKPRPSPPPFSSLGWSFAGAVTIAMSMPPLGLYPLAWVALVPLVVRWSVREPSRDYARELYALLLTTSCCLGFWLLFNPDPVRAAWGGASLFLTPVPLTVAFVLAGLVRRRWGTVVGLVALVLNVLAAEFVTLKLGTSVPWLVLGHTQVGALEFIQIADLGGVLLISLWVLALNVTAFLALPKQAAPAGALGSAPSVGVGERGVVFGAFAALAVLPVVYGGVRTAQSEVPSGYARIAIVQPGVGPRDWDAQTAPEKVRVLSSLSDDLVSRWAPADPASRARGGLGVGLLIWPQASLPRMATRAEEDRLYRRLADWGERRGVSLLAGAVSEPAETDRAARPGQPTSTNTAVLFRPGEPAVTYSPVRAVAVTDPSGGPGGERVLLDAGGTEIATTVGFESAFGDHVRRFTKSGANLIVVLSRNDLWGRSSGLYQHLMFTRLRAIESRRAVVLSTVGGVSAVITPGGRVDEVAGWMDTGAVAVDAPTFRHQTFYVRHGDWLGAWALVSALALGVGSGVLARASPTPRRRKTAVPLYG